MTGGGDSDVDELLEDEEFVLDDDPKAGAADIGGRAGGQDDEEPDGDAPSGRGR